MREGMCLDRALTSDIPFQVKNESSIVSNSYQIRVHTAECPREGEGVFHSPFCLVETALNRAQPIQGTFMRNRSGAAYPVGRIIFVPPGEPVSCQFTRGARRTLTCLFDISGLSVFDRVTWDWSQVDPAQAFDVRNSYVQMALQRLAQEAEAPGLSADIQVDCTLMFLVAELHRHFNGRGKSCVDDSSNLSRVQLATIRELVEDGMGTLPSLRILADALNLSPQALSVRFRNSAGKTLRNYLSEAKLERAKRLLMDDSLILKQVAHLSGFGCAATFAAAFRKDAGITPSEYRARIRLH
jgi:AraC family transcriptional regulator